MPGKQKSSDELNDVTQLKPLGKSSGRGKGWKGYLQSNAVKAGLVGVLVLLLVLIISWQLMFSGGSGPKSRGTPASTDQSQAQANPPPESTETMAPASTEPSETTTAQNGQTGAGDNQTGTAGSQPGEVQPEQQQPGGGTRSNGREGTPGTESATTQPQPLPEDVSKWTKSDFARARQEGNTKLLAAVAYLAEKFPGSVPVAQGLTELLKPLKPPDPSSPYSSYTGSPVPGLIEAIIQALGKNGSQAARQTMRQVLSGKITTDDDQAAVDAVLKTLVQIPSAENDDLLVKVLVTPEEIRPANQQVTSQSLDIRAKTLEVVKQSASENFCTKLAENLVQRGLEPNDPLVEFLLEDNSAYLSAQLVLYQSEDLSPDRKTKLDQSFLKYGSMAISLTMGIPIGVEGTVSTTPGGAWGGAAPTGREATTPTAGIMPGDTSRSKISDYDRGVQLAKLLWGEPLASLMTERLVDVRTLDKSTPEIILASTLPLDSIHAAMSKMLKKRAAFEIPPLTLETGWTDKDKILDPGLIVLMKMLPRSKAMKNITLVEGNAAAMTPGVSRTGRSPPMKPPVTDTTGLYATAAQKDMKWINLLYRMIGEWSNRFEAAAQAQKRAARRGLKVVEPPPTRIDEFELPQEAKVTAAYQLNWPEKAPADMGKVKIGTLKIQYFRLLQESTLKKMLADMKKLVKGSEVHALPNGFWLEVFKTGSKPNSKRSLDVLVTSPDIMQQPVEYPLKEEPTDLQIDILAVEISDPAKE